MYGSSNQGVTLGTHQRPSNMRKLGKVRSLKNNGTALDIKFAQHWGNFHGFMVAFTCQK